MVQRWQEPPAQLLAHRTRGVQLVQPVVDQGRVSGTGAGIGLQSAVPLQTPSLARQPTAQPEPLQQVAEEVPEQAAGQVQGAGGQGPAQCPEGQLQLLGGLGAVPLGIRFPGEARSECPEHDIPPALKVPPAGVPAALSWAPRVRGRLSSRQEGRGQAGFLAHPEGREERVMPVPTPFRAALTLARSRSACLRCLQKCTAGPEWGRVTGSP